MDAYVFAGTKAECCSAGGGQHWTLSDTAGGLDAVNSGDLVIFDNACGVALTDYDTDQDKVVVDRTGCHELEVEGKTYAGGNAAIAVGDALYYDQGDGALYKWDGGALDDGDVLVGEAMAAVASGETDTICVKLWPWPTPRTRS